MTPEHVTETAVGILADFLVLYAINSGGEVDLTCLFDQFYGAHEADPDAWDRARSKAIPMVQEIFIAYLHDSRIDLAKVISDHTDRINELYN